jgi:hypothetical protein
MRKRRARARATVNPVTKEGTKGEIKKPTNEPVKLLITKEDDFYTRQATEKKLVIKVIPSTR